VRIALIYPATDFDRRYHALAMPIGILYLAAVVEKRRSASVDVFDARHGAALPDLAYVNDYDVIGFSAMTTQISNALRLARRVRDAGFKGTLAFGGPHASVAADHLRSQSFVDAVFIGEAEETFLQYLDFLEGKPHQLERVWTRDSKGQWGFHPGESFVKDLDTLPFPAREKYGDLAARIRFINMTTTRGCPYQCNYCQPSKQILFGKRVRRRSVENIVAKIEDALQRYRIDRFSIDDDTFTFNEPTVLEFCERVRPFGLRWACQSRTDISRATLETMRDAGCEELYLGAESGSQRVLELMNKKNTVESNAAFIQMCNELGIRSWCNMMVGYPGETRRDMELSLEFVRKAKPSRVCVTQVTPFPGTYLWERNRDDVIDQDWDAFGRHVFRPKFKSMARKQHLLNYYQILMTREWGEPIGAEMLEHSDRLARLIYRVPFVLSIVKRRLPSLFHFLIRKGRRYLAALDEAVGLARSGHTEEGIRLLEELKRRFPTETDPLGHLGWIYLTTGRPDKAVENYTRLVALDPTNEEARTLLAKARQQASESHATKA
jgi:radical SAM superfamily enzyme YgiQ (UPF0313 family)